MTAHDHRTRVDGCPRCELSADEVDDCAALRHALEQVYAGDQALETDAVLDQLDTLGYRVVAQ